MKNKIFWFIFQILILISIFWCSIYSKNIDNVKEIINTKNASIDKNENFYDLYVMNYNSNGQKLVANNKNEIVYKQGNFDEDIVIIRDDLKNEPSLIRIYRSGEMVIYDDPDVDEEYENIWNKENEDIGYIYYDKNGNLINLGDDYLYINFVYNDYAVINNFDSNSYGRAKIYDLNKKKYVQNIDSLSYVEYKNNYLFGRRLSLINDKRDYENFLLDENLNVVRKITYDEYQDLNGEEYEDYGFHEDIIIATKHNNKYILDRNYNLLSKPYNADVLQVANFTDFYWGALKNNYNYDDYIFYRIENNKIIYFTLKKDIYEKIIYDEISNERKYSLDEDFVVGENNCYAKLDKYSNTAYVYSLDNDKVVATLSSILDYRHSEDFEEKYRNIFYIDDIYVFGNYVICNYYDDISKSYIPYMNVGNGYGGSILNLNEVKKTDSVIIKEFHNEPYQYVIDVFGQKIIKTLYNKYVDITIFNYENKYIYALQKEKTTYTDDGYGTYYDLYDNDFNLIKDNVYNIEQVSNMLYFMKSVYVKSRNNDDKLYDYYITIINFDNKILFECAEKNKSKIEYNIQYAGTPNDDGIIVKRHYKMNKDYDYEELFDSNKRKIVNINKIRKHQFIEKDEEIFLFINTDKETYIYKLEDEKYHLMKKFTYSLNLEQSTFISEKFGNNNAIDDKNRKKVFKMVDKDGLYYLLDNDFNIVLEGLKNIEITDTFYYYIDGFNICILDYYNNILSKICLYD